MEERTIALRGIMSEIYSPKQNKKIWEEISQQIKNIFMNQIREVYLINSRIREKGNYLPLEDVLSAIQVDFQSKTNSIQIYIDTDALRYRDSKNNPLYLPQHQRESSTQGVIENFEDHWYTPIQGLNEMDWAITTTIEKSTNYIRQNYNQITNKMGRTQK